MKYLIPFFLGAALFIGTSGALATGAYSVVVGGTGSTTLSGILSGNGTSPVQSVVIGSNLTYSGNVLSAVGAASAQVGTSSIPSIGNLAYWTSNGTPSRLGTVATSSISFTGPFNIIGALGTLVGGANATAIWTGLATTTQPASSNLLVSNGGAGVYGISTSSLAASSPLTGSFTQIGTGGSLGCQIASGSQTGCLSSTDWTTFNTKGSVSSVGLSSTNSTLTVGSTPVTTAGTITADLNLGHSNGWTALQTFLVASSTLSSHTKTAYFGGTATTTINADGNGSVVVPSAGSITDSGLGTPAGTFLAADASGKVIATSSPNSGIFTSVLGYFGTGSDGTLTFDGVSTVDGIVPSGKTYILTKDINATSITVNSGVTINDASYKILASTSFTNNGTTTNNGISGGNGGASGGTAGGAIANGSIGGSFSGGAGGNNTSGTNGTNGTNSIGGSGGNGGSGNHSGGTGGSTTGAVVTLNYGYSLQMMAFLTTSPSLAFFEGGAGGGGGGGGSGSGDLGGGGGGGGGGIIYVASPSIVNNANLLALGGIGGNGGGTLNLTGGAGGGGGGSVVLIYVSYTANGTVSVAGGAGGAAGGAGGGGGSSGGSGTINLFQI